MTAIGYVTKQADGHYKGTLRTVSIKADIDILPNTLKTSDTQPDFRVMTEGIEIGAGWTRKGETSNKEYVSLSIAAPEFGPKKLCAILGKAVGSDHKDLYAAVWDRFDQTKAPAQVYTGAIIFSVGQVLMFSNNAATFFQLSPQPVPPRSV